MRSPKRIAYLKQWYKDHPTYDRDYYTVHKEKINRVSALWTKNNPKKHAIYAKKVKNVIRAEFRLLLNSFKDKPCLDCGNIYPVICMDFDHRDSTKKYRDISVMCGFPKEKILKEIAKCDVVCANCHRIRTQKQRNYYQPIPPEPAPQP